jgi:peptidoglycan/xylan/chitin deacetylase (PgdA/CDA1 family)
MTDPWISDRRALHFRSMAADALGTKLVARAGRTLMPATADGRLSVMIFHRILEAFDPMRPDETTAVEFHRNMQTIASHFNVLSLSEGLRRLRDGSLPPYSICLTFDDGYRDNYTVALPILEEFGLTATFFVATDYINGGRMWNDAIVDIVRRWPEEQIDLSQWGVPPIPLRTTDDRLAAKKSLQKWMRRIGIKGRDEMLDRLGKCLPKGDSEDLMLSSEQIADLARRGMEIGSHTRSHPILTRIDNDSARSEIVSAKSVLEDIAQRPVRYFAYPNGIPGDDYDKRHVRMVEEAGYDAAFSTAWGVAVADSDRFQLPRFTPWDRTSARYVLRFLLSRRHTSCRVAA